MKLLSLFSPTGLGKYRGLSDFMINASPDRKIKVFTEVARRATQEQRKVIEKAGITL